MGVVYLAQNRLMGRMEVLKVVGSHLINRRGVLDRFVAEIRNAARLHHTNVVTAYSASRHGESLVLAMEYVEGLDLSRIVKAHGPLPVAKACNYVHQAALGLQHAHENGMVHRDIKPSNLMLARQGNRAVIKVLDFGLAKVQSEGAAESGLTHEGQMLGTPDYIAPEQISNARRADIRADIYSLGCTFYYLLTGGPPFQGTSLYDILQAHHSMEARPLNLKRPEVPVELAALVAKMMAKEPERRFQTPKDVAEALKPFFKSGTAASVGSKPDISQIRPQEARPKTAHGTSMSTQAATQSTSKSVAHERTPPPPTVSEPMWENLIESREPEPSPAVAEPSRRTSPWIWPAVAASILLLGMVVAWAAGVFKVKTADGIIVLENVPKDSEILVNGEKITFTWPGGGKPVVIRAVPGKRRVEVKTDGFKTFGEVVTVKTEDSEEVTVRLEPLVVERSGKEPPDAALGLRFAALDTTGGRSGLPPGVSESSARERVDRSPVMSATDAVQVGSVWVAEPGNYTFTVLEREGERFKALFVVGKAVREVKGTIRDRRIRWLARDVKAMAGRPGGDNEGEIQGNEVAMSWSDPGGPIRGYFKLRLQKPASGRAQGTEAKKKDS